MYTGDISAAADFRNNCHCIPQSGFFDQPPLKGYAQRTAVRVTIADVELLPNESEHKIPNEYLPAVDILRNLLEQLGYPFAKLEKHYDDASWVGSRLAELLPLRLEHKQYLLQLDDPIQRLDRLWQLMEELELR